MEIEKGKVPNNYAKLCVDVANVKFEDANKHQYFAKLDAEKMGKYYTVHSGKIAFMTKNAEYMVSPFVEELIPVLESAGFVESYLIMQPFTNGATALDPNVTMRMHALTTAKKEYTNENNIISGRKL